MGGRYVGDFTCRRVWEDINTTPDMNGKEELLALIMDLCGDELDGKRGQKHGPMRLIVVGCGTSVTIPIVSFTVSVGCDMKDSICKELLRRITTTLYLTVRGFAVAKSCVCK